MADDARRDNRAGGPLQCGGVRRSAQELALAGVVSGLCAGCLPEGAPPWLVDHEIAAALTIAMGTVKTHIGSLLAKLHARDRAQLVIAAYDRGLAGSGPGRPHPAP